MTIRECAQELGGPELYTTVWRAIQYGALRASRIRVGPDRRGPYRVSRADFEKYKASLTFRPVQPAAIEPQGSALLIDRTRPRLSPKGDV